jgi:hypothetical protein
MKIGTNVETNPKKQGTWKFNNSLLADSEYTSKCNKKFKEWAGKYADVKDHGLKWDLVKTEIRTFTIGYCSYKNKLKKENEKTLIEELKDLEIEMCNKPNEDIKQRMQTTTNQLKDIDKDKLRGAQLRAHCMHINDNEYNTKYFLNKEKTKAEAKTMTVMMTDDNKLITDSKTIAKEQRNFYKKLYSDDPTIDKNESENALKYFLNGNYEIENLEKSDKENLDQPISKQEIANSLKELANNKSPGSDGLTTNYYKFFWTHINELVSASILHGVETGKLSIEQRRAVLTLLPKKEKDARFLKNWRPLSILNTDYKILAKILAMRLQDVLPDIINQDQAGCIKGRSTFNNIRGTYDIINYVNVKRMPGFLAFIDYEKAFDTVRWPFLFACLERMNFGNTYINYVKSLYKEICTHVANRGALSESFEPARGIRQGCPLSANLFVIIVEAMASAIRQNPKIIGIKIGKKVCKISQYADDTCIYVSNIDSLKMVLDILHRFAKCSGLKINKDKSEVMAIGASSNFKHKTLGLKWPKTAIKCLGIYFYNDVHKIQEDNFRMAFNKCESILKMWNLQQLTLKGKVTIVNTLVIPQILYVSTVMTPPKNMIQSIKNLITNFLWSGKPPKIKYTCIINTLEMGGLKLQDVESKIKSLKLKWLKAMCDKEIEGT